MKKLTETRRMFQIRKAFLAVKRSVVTEVGGGKTDDTQGILRQ